MMWPIQPDCAPRRGAYVVKTVGRAFDDQHGRDLRERRHGERPLQISIALDRRNLAFVLSSKDDSGGKKDCCPAEFSSFEAEHTPSEPVIS
eukprot:scaffold8108_cov267-Pinguiococcus_pyrenoidosus.AAC.6